jgi:hypothetical protein
MDRSGPVCIVSRYFRRVSNYGIRGWQKVIAFPRESLELNERLSIRVSGEGRFLFVVGLYPSPKAHRILAEAKIRETGSWRD